MNAFQLLLVAAEVMSVVLFILMGVDKYKAENDKRRIPERTLMLLAAAFGAAGGLLGMLAFNHKTRKPKFYIGFPLLFLLNIAVIAAVWYFTK